MFGVYVDIFETACVNDVSSYLIFFVVLHTGNFVMFIVKEEIILL